MEPLNTGMNSTHKKNLFIKTYGCDMNVYDSEKMRDLLHPHGFQHSKSIDNADMVILNTCHIREKASEKVFSELGKIKKYKMIRKEEGSEMVIVVAGCTAQAVGEEIIKRAPYVDIVVGPQSYHNLPTLIEKIKRENKWAVSLDFPVESKFDSLPRNTSVSKATKHTDIKYSALLSVQEGCDKFCHFCCVPYTRGAEYSRPVAEIFREANNLVHSGAKEITLLGQNVSAYHGLHSDGESWGLGKLIKAICKIDGLERLRYLTSHPRDMVEEDLYIAHRDEEKLMPFLHLPVQSGSNNVLKGMNRKHTREEYFKIIDKFRRMRKDIAFSSDFIVGYPGETEKDFEDTLDLVKHVEYAQCFSFKYSPRAGTPAAAVEDQIPEEVKSERLYRLQELIREQQLKFNSNSVGSVVPVLFEKDGKHDGQILGKSPHLQSVFIDGDSSLLGEIREVEITASAQNSICGQLVEKNTL